MKTVLTYLQLFEVSFMIKTKVTISPPGLDSIVIAAFSSRSKKSCSRPRYRVYLKKHSESLSGLFIALAM